MFENNVWDIELSATVWSYNDNLSSENSVLNNIKLDIEYIFNFSLRFRYENVMCVLVYKILSIDKDLPELTSNFSQYRDTGSVLSTSKFVDVRS